jgi:WD40 repeat protein
MGGAGKKLQFFNATNNNNSALFQYVLSSNVVGTDFSNDGKYLVVSTNDGTIYIYSQICNYCDSSSFYNSTSKICQRCADPTFPNLAGCAACYNSTTCYQCFQGYYLNTSGVCQTCFSSKDGCSVCLNATYCEVAMPGYFLNTTSHAPTTCISVIPGCQICDNATKCN